MGAYEDELRRQRDLIEQLLADEPTYRRRAADYRRGSLPASSLGSGANGGMVDSPMLESDPVDARLAADKKARMLSARRVTNELEAQRRAQTRVTAVAGALPEPTCAPCQRLTCNEEVTNIGSDRLRPSPLDGLRICPGCYVHERRHQTKRVVNA